MKNFLFESFTFNRFYAAAFYVVELNCNASMTLKLKSKLKSYLMAFISINRHRVYAVLPLLVEGIAHNRLQRF